MARTPIFDNPMTPAERQRRSRQAKREGVQLRGGLGDPKSLARMLGGSPQFYRDMSYVQQHGVPEWKQLLENGKGRMIIGAAAQRQMVKYLSPKDQRDMIEIAKEDKKHALAVWRLLKGASESSETRKDSPFRPCRASIGVLATGEAMMAENSTGQKESKRPYVSGVSDLKVTPNGDTLLFTVQTVPIRLSPTPTTSRVRPRLPLSVHPTYSGCGFQPDRHG